MNGYNRHESQLLPPIPQGAILIDKFNELGRLSFFDQMCQKVTLLSQEMRLKMDDNGDVGIAALDYRVEEHPSGLLVLEAEIFVLQEAFTLNGVNDMDLIPITVEHEITEAWVDLLSFFDDESQRNHRLANGIGHKSGVMAEYVLAHKLGLAERYLELVTRWAQEMSWQEAQVFLEENFQAYSTTHHFNGNGKNGR